MVLSYNGKICVFLSICEEDVLPWGDSFLQEMERLGLPFVVNFDRCSASSKELFRSHSCYLGSTAQNDPVIEFTEMSKQPIFDLLCSFRLFHWAIAWDADEVFDKGARVKLEGLIGKENRYDYLRTGWANCWGDRDHVRIDTVFANARRVKIYNVSGRRKWIFDHPVVNGCKLANAKGTEPTGKAVMGETDIICLHLGLMTRELREQHKARWDRIYTAAVGANQYGFWNYCLDEKNYPPTVKRNEHL